MKSFQALFIASALLICIAVTYGKSSGRSSSKSSSKSSSSKSKGSSSSSSGGKPYPVQQWKPAQPQPSAPHYAQPSAPHYAQPSAPNYGQPSAPHYGQPSAPNYGQPSAPHYAQPSAPHYGQPGAPSYGQPGAPSYGQPGAPSYGQPSNPNYGQPIGHNYGQPSGHNYGQPIGHNYGQPSGNNYGQPNLFSKPKKSSNTNVILGAAAGAAVGAYATHKIHQNVDKMGINSNTRSNTPTGIRGHGYRRTKNPLNEIIFLAQISREEWGAEPITEINTRGFVEASKIIVHHTKFADCYNLSSCIVTLKEVEKHNKNVLGLPDIGYNFMIGGDGRIYHGLGWHLYSRITNSSYDPIALQIAFIGDFSIYPPTERQLEAFRALVKYADNKDYIKSYRIHGHRDVACTSCPGEALYRKLKIMSRFEALGIDTVNRCLQINQRTAGSTNMTGLSIPDESVPVNLTNPSISDKFVPTANLTNPSHPEISVPTANLTNPSIPDMPTPSVNLTNPSTPELSAPSANGPNSSIPDLASVLDGFEKLTSFK